MNRKVILYIAMSVDGYIAKPGDNLDFLNMVQEEGEDYGYYAFEQTVDTVIMGRKTYDWVMKQVPEFPHAQKNAFIITRTPRQDIGKTRFYTGNLKELVSNLKAEQGKNIFVDGGAEIVQELLKEKLIDEFIISIIPVFLGSGTLLFKEGQPEQELKLIRAESFPSGLVQVHYSRKIDKGVN
jgi:dihydrofolate reductase